MKPTTKYIIIAAMLVFITIGATLWVKDLFTPKTEKKAYKQAEIDLKQLEKDYQNKIDSLIASYDKELTEKQAEIGDLKKQRTILNIEKNESNKKLNDLYRSLDSSDDARLDSLRAAFRQKTGG